jgi:ADP-heptose:LPS heptosyltransferase
MEPYPNGALPPSRGSAIVAVRNALERPPAADRILILRLGAVGDVVRTLPAASAVRRAWPGAHLAWLVEPPGASLLRAQAWLDEVLVFPRPELRDALRGLRPRRAAGILRGFLRELRARRFDLVLDFHSIAKSGLLSRASGARRRVAYARPYGRELAWLCASETARLDPPRASRFERNAALVRFLGLEPHAAARPLALDDALRAGAAAALGPGPAPVVMHPGTSDRTPHKRWPPAAYAAVARALAAETGAPCLVTCGPARDDREAAQAVVAAADGAARLAPPTRGLAELAALFERCRLYVGGDSGPLHVASLVGTPVVQILGPTDPVENAPWPGTPSRTLRVPVACSPCRRGCAAATCMRVVSPGAVVEAARALLASGGSGC